MFRFRSCARSAVRAGRPIFHGLAVFGLLVLAAVLAPTARADEILYAGDYNGDKVSRFDGSTGAGLAPNPFIQPGGESIAGYGAYILAESSDVVKQYNLSDGSYTGNSITLPGFGLGIAVALDAQSVYVTESNQIVQYSLQPGNFGAVLATASTPDSWGVAINPTNGQVYVNNGWNSYGTTGIQVFSPNLTPVTTIPTSGVNGGMTAGSGIVFSKDGSDFYAVNGGNADPSHSFLNEYTASGTFVQTIALTGTNVGNPYTMSNAFGAAIDNAGNIFVSSQADNTVVEANVSGSTPTTSVFIQSNNGFTSSIKTIFFSGQTIKPIPEPTSIVLMVSAIPAALVFWTRRRRRTTVA